MTAKEFVARLAEFESAEEIAATCAVLGITGKRESEKSCPLAVIAACDGHRVSVGEETVRFHDATPDGWGDMQYLPGVASAFVRSFDLGAWPELAREPRGELSEGYYD